MEPVFAVTIRGAGRVVAIPEERIGLGSHAEDGLDDQTGGRDLRLRGGLIEHAQAATGKVIALPHLLGEPAAHDSHVLRCLNPHGRYLLPGSGSRTTDPRLAPSHPVPGMIRRALRRTIPDPSKTRQDDPSVPSKW